MLRTTALVLFSAYVQHVTKQVLTTYEGYYKKKSSNTMLVGTCLNDSCSMLGGYKHPYLLLHVHMHEI